MMTIITTKNYLILNRWKNNLRRFTLYKAEQKKELKNLICKKFSFIDIILTDNILSIYTSK